MRLISLLLLLLGGFSGHAQYQHQSWLHLSYTYSDLTYKEPGAMTEKGRLAGIRGEAGLSLGQALAVSIGGEYQDGNLNYDGSTFGGTPVKQVTKDYIRDLRAMVHLVYQPMVLSAGFAERYWFDDLVISYRRRTKYVYTPITVTYFMQSTYVTIEHDLWSKGTNTSHMSDVNPAARDVNFTLGKGTGFGVEIGYMLPTPPIATRLFLRYHKWDVKESDVQSDGTQNLIEPDNNTTLIQAGIGLQF